MYTVNASTKIVRNNCEIASGVTRADADGRGRGGYAMRRRAPRARAARAIVAVPAVVKSLEQFIVCS